eukprot:9227411-Heterocapsa_arctica.AAC.1
MRRTERSRPAKAGEVTRSLATARSGRQLASLKLRAVAGSCGTLAGGVGLSMSLRDAGRAAVGGSPGTGREAMQETCGVVWSERASFKGPRRSRCR